MRNLAIGLVTNRKATEDPQEEFENIASLGVEVLQLGGMPRSFLRYRPGELVEIARESNLRIVSATVSHEGEDYSTLESIAATGGLNVEFEHRLDNFKRSADWLAEAEVHHVTSHIGFIPEDQADARRGTLAERVRAVVAALAQRGIHLALETGQETAANLKAFLDELSLDGLSVNLDPANMILYGKGDPSEAIDILGPAIGSVHCKDAVHSSKPGVTWGREVPFGQGDVDAEAWLTKLLAAGFTGPMIIERESGESRNRDVAAAVEIIRKVREAR